MSNITIERAGISERARQQSYLDLNDPNVTVTSLYLEGLEIASQRSISKDRKATVEDIMSNSYGFASLSAVGNGDVGELSFGLPWTPDQSTFRTVAERMVATIADGLEGAQIEWFGDSHIDIAIESTLSPEEFIRRLVEAPVPAYHDQPHLLDAFTTVQKLRAKNLLGSTGKGKMFTDIVEGRRPPGLIRAYQPKGDNLIEDKSEEGELSFVWNYERKNGELEGLDPVKNERQTITDLAKPSKTVTIDMSRGLLKKQEFLSQSKDGVYKYLFSIYWDPSVACCRTASAAQYFKTDEMIESSKAIQQSSLIKSITNQAYAGAYLHDRENNFCKEHNKNKTECKCKDTENKDSKKSN